MHILSSFYQKDDRRNIMATKNREKLRRNQAKYRANNIEKVKESNKIWRSSDKGRFADLKKGAKKRKKEMLLSFKEFCLVIKDPCYYCDGFFRPTTTGAGIDRKDNNKGYIIDNVVSCCWTCNSIKNGILSVEETKAVINLVIKMRNSDKTEHFYKQIPK